MGEWDRWFHPTRILEYWFVLVPAALTVGLASAWAIDRRAQRRREIELERLCGSRDQAEHLVVLEMASHPGLSRERARDAIVKRLRR